MATGRTALAAAAAAGTLHGLISLYWGVGGRWLIETVGQTMLDAFAGREWMLVPVALVKFAAAWAPVWLAARGWPWRRVTRGLSWCMGAILVAWGGVSAIVANLVLAGVVAQGGPIDRPAMVGHAWLWDPLFLVWGMCLAVGLWVSRRAAHLS